MKSVSVFILLITVGVLPAADLKYHFSFCVEGDVQGTFLLIFPYRVFFTVSGSAEFIARADRAGQFHFYFQRATTPALLLRSVSYNGKHFVVIAADYDMDSALVFMVNQVSRFKSDHPFYAGIAKEFRKLVVRIPPSQEGSIQFTRSRNGILKRHSFHLKLDPSYDETAVDIFFNPYEIMIGFLKAYNHSFLPESSPGTPDSPQIWQSKPLDFSGQLNEVAWKVARILRKVVRFKQRKMFRLTYRYNRTDESVFEILGEAHPDIKIWKGFKITDFYRKARLKTHDRTLVEDSIRLEIRNKNGSGGSARASLTLVD